MKDLGVKIVYSFQRNFKDIKKSSLKVNMVEFRLSDLRVEMLWD